MFLFMIPVFMYTAIHIIAIFQKLNSNEADGHILRALGGIFALYILLGFTI